jgi:TonB family protein
MGGVGFARMADYASVDNEIKRRATVLPLAIAQGSTQDVVVFFPITPVPGRIEIAYTEGAGEHRIAIDTREVLAAAHGEQAPLLRTRAEPRFPKSARRADVMEGYVKARLSINPTGSVGDIRIVESHPPGVFDREAKTTWNYFRYTPDAFAGPREVEDTMVFKDPTR